MNSHVNKSLIEKYLKANKLSKKEFCKKCKIGISTLRRVMSDKDVYLISLFRIAKKMKIPVSELFVE